MSLTRRWGAVLVALVLWLAAPPAVIAQAAETAVGEVRFAKGVVSATRPGETPRLVGKGMALYESDLLESAARSFAVLRMRDGSALTLRPESTLSLVRYAVAEDGTAEPGGALLGLLKGGLRMLTGLVARRNPDAFSIQAGNATIGIRGTEFDARLCAGDCAAEGGGTAAGARRDVIGRVTLASRPLRAFDAAGGERTLTVGGAVYEGDLLETAEAGFAAVVFHDGGHTTLRAGTRLRVSRYGRGPEGESVALSLLRGGLRVLTGLIAKARTDSFRLSTAIATIGIRGTGFDVWCSGACASEAGGLALPDPNAADGLYVHVWDGAVETLAGGCAALGTETGETAFQADADSCAALLPAIPEFIRDDPAPRPDRVPADLQNLFGMSAVADDEPGLYVSVRDGHVVLAQEGVSIDLGRGESGYAPPLGEARRLAVTPGFLADDPYPPPSDFDERVQRILELFDDGNNGAGVGECTM